MRQSEDITIVGAGITGLVMANLLVQSGHKIVIVEKNLFEFHKFDNKITTRVSAINLKSQEVFRKIKVWDSLKTHACAYQKMQVWQQHDNDNPITFHANDTCTQQLGYILPNQDIEHALWQQLRQAEYAKQLTVISPENCQTISFLENKDCLLTLNDNSKLQSQLLIGADGASSWIRQQCNIFTKGNPYEQVAMVFNVECENKHQDTTAWQCFLKTGPLAFLPLTKNTYSIVWSTTHTFAKEFMHATSQERNKQLNDIVQATLGKVAVISDVKTFPLCWQHATKYFHKSTVLIGDAAHVIHPLAGQGVNLGIMDAETLSNILQTHKRKSRDLNSISVMQKYQRARKQPNTQMMQLMTGINEVFKNDSQLVKGLLSVGIKQFNKSTILRRLAMQYANGL